MWPTSRRSFAPSVDSCAQRSRWRSTASARPSWISNSWGGGKFMNRAEPLTVSAWVAGPLPKDVELAIERIQGADDVQRIAVMPDVHLASEFCVGTVVATSHLLYPNAVGGDIGCGMAALRFRSSFEVLADRSNAARLMSGLYAAVPTRRHHARTPRDLPTELEQMQLSAGLEGLKRRDGRTQFGTLGSGNHFVEFQRDDQGWLWLMVHSGSRAVGQAIRDLHMRNATTGRSGLKYLDAHSDLGEAYVSDLNWALKYARGNRRRIADAVAAVGKAVLALDPDEETYFDCQHNYVRRQPIGDEVFWVHRKGAISARENEPGIIPGS